jgi:colicin import membrane protein
MATTNTLLTTPASDANDPFRFGWRSIRCEHPDGTETWERVPLTLEDLLHPQEEDFIVQSRMHHLLMDYLHMVFASRLANDPTAVVLADVRVAWDVPGLGAHGPDIAVITGVRELKDWRTFDVAVEGVRPVLIAEITSPSTAHFDRTTKLEEYEAAGVQTYVIVDTVSRRGEPRVLLFAYALTPTGYQPIPPDQRGWIWLDVVRVWLGVADGELTCFDEHGQPLGDYIAVSEALHAEKPARALAERQAQVETEARQAVEALARAEAEARALAERRAEAEATARTLAEERLRQLEAEMARLRGGA